MSYVQPVEQSAVVSSPSHLHSNFNPALPPPSPCYYSIETVRTYFTWVMVGWGGGGGESLPPFYHDAMGGCQVA